MVLQPLVYWDCGFESRRGHGCLSLVNVGCYQVEVFAQGRSLVLRSSTECGVSEYDLEPSIMKRPWPTVGCCSMGKKSGLFINDPVSSTGFVESNSMANWNFNCNFHGFAGTCYITFSFLFFEFCKMAVFVWFAKL